MFEFSCQSADSGKPIALDETKRKASNPTNRLIKAKINDEPYS
jgi:hypothetical protein